MCSTSKKRSNDSSRSPAGNNRGALSAGIAEGQSTSVPPRPRYPNRPLLWLSIAALTLWILFLLLVALRVVS